ncbi:upstream activation factor subunit spp27-like [Musa acuminata AAA Group]|uniref:upstream activation factor subunit spp27-like n=1 Tax=Musa acuminata AAA Group TaxID=214697 RepID=UPI0031E1976F
MSRVFGGCRTLAAVAARPGTKASAAAPAVISSPSSTAAKPKHSGILKPIPVSLAMRKFLGVPEISRSQAVKKIWEYIKGHQLQNPANKKEICCDEKLKTLFEDRDKVGMLEIAKLISPHFLKSK